MCKKYLEFKKPFTLDDKIQKVIELAMNSSRLCNLDKIFVNRELKDGVIVGSDGKTMGIIPLTAEMFPDLTTGLWKAVNKRNAITFQYESDLENYPNWNSVVNDTEFNEINCSTTTIHPNRMETAELQYSLANHGVVLKNSTLEHLKGITVNKVKVSTDNRIIIFICKNAIFLSYSPQLQIQRFSEVKVKYNSTTSALKEIAL